MIKPISELQRDTIEIDLTGEQGNGFFLLGLARGIAKTLERDPEPIIEDMMAGDYEHLIQVLDREFGEYVTMYR